jgi:hypothetical protein
MLCIPTQGNSFVLRLGPRPSLEGRGSLGCVTVVTRLSTAGIFTAGLRCSAGGGVSILPYHRATAARFGQ